MTKKLPSPNLWEREYRKSGIPSSFRDKPSGSLVEFVRYIQSNNIRIGTALDIGCGRGRNSLYLAKIGFDVWAIDFVAGLIDGLQSDSRNGLLPNNIHPFAGSVIEPWPFNDSFLDIAIDAFCYKHQVSVRSRVTYRTELARCLKSGAYYLLTLAGTDDGYYGPLQGRRNSSGWCLITDPLNNIKSVLYTREEIERAFSKDFVLVQHEHKKKMGIMHGGEYLRSTHIFYFRRR